MWIYSYGSIAETGPKNNVVGYEAINLIALCGFIIIIPLISIQLWSINTDTLFIATLRLLTVIKLDIVKSAGSLVCICATCFCCTPKVLFFPTLAQPLHLNCTKNPTELQVPVCTSTLTQQIQQHPHNRYVCLKWKTWFLPFWAALFQIRVVALFCHLLYHLCF